MPNPISSMKVADPGVGFTVDLNQLTASGNGQNGLDTNKGLKILVRIFDNENKAGGNHQCYLFINRPLDTAEELVVVLPFDCGNFGNLNSLLVEVNFMQPGGDGTGEQNIGPDSQPYVLRPTELHKNQVFQLDLT